MVCGGGAVVVDETGGYPRPDEHTLPRRSTNDYLKPDLAEPLPHGQAETLARLVSYAGNPHHKRNPGNFGLKPPSAPRLDRSLCDDVSIFKREEATRLLREGARRSMISRTRTPNGDWPKQIWAVTDSGRVVEARIDNQVQGSYHGYPMEPNNPHAALVFEKWHERSPPAAPPIPSGRKVRIRKDRP